MDLSDALKPGMIASIWRSCTKIRDQHVFRRKVLWQAIERAMADPLGAGDFSHETKSFFRLLEKTPSRDEPGAFGRAVQKVTYGGSIPRERGPDARNFRKALRNWIHDAAESENGRKILDGLVTWNVRDPERARRFADDVVVEFDKLLIDPPNMLPKNVQALAYRAASEQGLIGKGEEVAERVAAATPEAP